MYSVRPPVLFRLFSRKHLVCSLQPEEKILYLTFDDGPVPEVTPEILKILLDKKAGATFFCVGENIRKHPEVFREILAEGHSVGNHSYNHLDGWRTPPGEYAENVSRCDALLTTNLFRPPYGRFSLSQYYLLRRKYRFVLWSVLSGDFHQRTSSAQCLSNVLRNSKSGSIIVFHDSLKSKEKVLYSLPRLIDHFMEKGFRFESIALL